MVSSLFVLLVLLLGSFIHGSGQEVQNSLVSDLFISVELGFINIESGDSDSTSLEDHDGELKVSKDITWFLDKDWVGNQQRVLGTFADSELSSNFVFERSNGEAESWASFVDFVHELSSVLSLEVVLLRELSLVDGGSELRFLWLSLSGGDEDIDGKDLVDLEFGWVSLLVEGLLVEDDVVSIDEVLFDLMREDSLDGVNLIGVSDFLEGFSDLLVGVAWLEESEGSLGLLVGSQNNISFSSSNDGVLGLADDGMGG